MKLSFWDFSMKNYMEITEELNKDFAKTIVKLKKEIKQLEAEISRLKKVANYQKLAIKKKDLT